MSLIWSSEGWLKGSIKRSDMEQDEYCGSVVVFSSLCRKGDSHPLWRLLNTPALMSVVWFVFRLGSLVNSGCGATVGFCHFFILPRYYSCYASNPFRMCWDKYGSGKCFSFSFDVDPLRSSASFRLIARKRKRKKKQQKFSNYSVDL